MEKRNWRQRAIFERVNFPFATSNVMLANYFPREFHWTGKLNRERRCELSAKYARYSKVSFFDVRQHFPVSYEYWFPSCWNPFPTEHQFCRIWCKGLAFLCTLLGVTWLVGLLYMETDLPHVVQYLFVLLNGLQGVYIFIFQCILNNQVRPVLVQFFMRRTKKTHHSSFSRISVSTIVSFPLETQKGGSSWD